MCQRIVRPPSLDKNLEQKITLNCQHPPRTSKGSAPDHVHEQFAGQLRLPRGKSSSNPLNLDWLGAVQYLLQQPCSGPGLPHKLHLQTCGIIYHLPPAGGRPLPHQQKKRQCIDISLQITIARGEYQQPTVLCMFLHPQHQLPPPRWLRRLHYQVHFGGLWTRLGGIVEFLGAKGICFQLIAKLDH